MRRVAVPHVLTAETAKPRPDGRSASLAGKTMGVTWSVRAWVPPVLSDAALSAAVQAACDTVVAQMSTWEPGSDLNRYNDAPAGAWVPAPAHLLTVVSAALEVAELSEGAFDPTVGPLVDLWGFGPHGPVVSEPTPTRLQAVSLGWRDIRVDGPAGRIFQPGGLRLDLSGIAKGYGVDLVAEALTSLGVRDFLVEIGGELRGSGVKGDGEPWWVELEAPPDSRLTELPVLVALHSLSVATSGDWRRTWSSGGRRYSHTLDPATRAPVDDVVAAVSVLDPDCMRADALCTALTVLGPAARYFAVRHDIPAAIVFRDGPRWTEWASPALARLLD